MKSIIFRLLLAFITIISLLLLQGVLSVFFETRLHSVQREAAAVEAEYNSIHEKLIEQRLIVYRLLGTSNPYEMDALKNQYADIEDYLETNFDSIGINSPEYGELITSYDDIIRLHYDFYTKTARNMMNKDTVSVFSSVENALLKHRTYQIMKSENAIARTMKNSIFLTISIAVAALAVSIIWALVLRNTFTYKSEAESELSSLRNYLQNIIDSMPSAIIAVDSSGKVILFNYEAGKCFADSGLCIGCTNIEDFLPENIDIYGLISGTLESGRPESLSKIKDIKEDSEIYSDITLYPIEELGQRGVVIRIDDVTEKARMDEVLVQTEKMLSVGGLAAGMAHEINNPLAAIVQTGNVMTERLINTGMESNRKAADEAGIDMTAISSYIKSRGIPRMLDTINEAGIRISEIVKNMLSFSRKTETAFESRNPAELVDRIIELASTDFDLKKKFDFKEIKIIKNYSDGLPEIECHSSKIQQVLLNILKNGAQAMFELKAPAQDFQPSFIITIKKQGPDFICIEIKDNGPGMPEDVRKRIFEPFFSTKEPGIGTGLGLSVSYFIITHDHGGEIRVETSPGRGANFIISLPVKQG